MTGVYCDIQFELVVLLFQHIHLMVVFVFVRFVCLCARTELALIVPCTQAFKQKFLKRNTKEKSTIPVVTQQANLQKKHCDGVYFWLNMECRLNKNALLLSFFYCFCRLNKNSRTPIIIPSSSIFLSSHSERVLAISFNKYTNLSFFWVLNKIKFTEELAGSLGQSISNVTIYT